MLKGERNPFDTAVAIHIDTYRMETEKFNLADILIKSLKQQLVLSEEVERQQGMRIVNLLEIRTVMEEQLAERARTIEQLTEMYRPPDPTWWERNRHNVFFIGGVVTGGGVAYLLMK